MITSIRPKGLFQFYETGNSSKLLSEYVRKINRILDQLDAVTLRKISLP
jgi:proteic killer suppression protein